MEDNVIRFPYTRRVKMEPNMDPPDLRCALCDEAAIAVLMHYPSIPLCQEHYEDTLPHEYA